MRFILISLSLLSTNLYAQSDEACLELLRGSLIAVKNGDVKSELYLYDRFENECEPTQTLQDLAEEDEHFADLVHHLESQGLRSN